MQDTVAIPATFIEPQPASDEDRTLTYPLRAGGSLVHTCPDWCADDHAREIEHGLNDPADLQHLGAPIALSFDDVDGERETILAARLVQWPFAADGDSQPYVDLTPEASTAESLMCRDRFELDNEIRRVRAHLRRLIEMGDRLAQAQADDHARRSPGSREPWLSLTRTDLLSMPIAYLVKVFGITAVETEEIGRPGVLALFGEPGAMELRVLPDVPQHLREDETRRCLLNRFDRQAVRNATEAGA
ncbi:DUF6907 domain-containing protein [Streptomyces canus]|uniref:DUF6907 domain-containing protein n=1 Tax=Streptomyces canus TaxID=58343 RepID=UPI00037204AC|nr:hypothetical protein [Streptomyces canus]